MLQIVYGESVERCFTQLFGLIKTGVEKKRRQILIVPETLSHEAERALLLSCSNSAAFYAEVLSFSKLSKRILEQAEEARPMLDAGGKALLMYQAFRMALPALTYYRDLSKAPKLCPKLIEASDELKAANASPDLFLSIAERADMSPKIRDIALIYSTYCALCEQGAFDASDAITIAAKALSGASDFAQADIYIGGFSGFTAQEYRMIESLLLSRGDVRCALLRLPEGALMHEEVRTRARILRLCESLGVAAEEIGDTGFAAQDGQPGGFSMLPGALFDFSRGAIPEPGIGVQLYSAKDVREECELTAALVRQLALQGTRLRDIKVICGDIGAYERYIERAFMRYDIPIFLSRKSDVVKKPAAYAALGGLQSLVDGLRSETVFSWLKSGVSLLEPCDLDELLNYVLTWGIRGQKWFSEWTKPSTGYANPVPDEAERIGRINRARGQVAEVLSVLERALSRCKTGGDFAQALAQHLEHIDFSSRMENRVERLRARGLEREASEYAQVYEIIEACIEQFRLVMGDEPMDRRSFLSLFELAVRQFDVSTIPVSLDSVTLSDTGRVPLGHIEHLFIVGANDGTFPQASYTGGLIGELDRVQLEAHGIEFPKDALRQALMAQSNISAILLSVTGSATFSYAKSDLKGQEMRESYVISRMQKLLPDVRVQPAQEVLRALELTARSPLKDAAYSGFGGGLEEGHRQALAYLTREDGDFPRRLAALQDYQAMPRLPLSSRAAIQALYGDEIRLTASRVERASSCRFSYFMQYGLNARPQKPASFIAPNVGTYVHYVVENCVRELLQGEGSAADLVERYTRRFIERELWGSVQESARFSGLFHRLKTNAIEIVQDVMEEIACSDFKPKHFEMAFGLKDSPPLKISDGEVRVSLSGKIDRVDVYEQGEESLIKVVDYKTGSKKFKISDLLYGLNLQMFLYMLLFQETGGGKPCAALYIPVKNPYIKAEGEEKSAESLARKRHEELRRSGVLLSDQAILSRLERAEEEYRYLPVKRNKSGELSKAYSSAYEPAELTRMIEHGKKMVLDVGRKLYMGDVQANPYRTGLSFAICDWCDYKDACHFDESMPSDRFRPLKSFSDSEVNAILKEQSGEGDEQDA